MTNSTHLFSSLIMVALLAAGCGAPDETGQAGETATQEQQIEQAVAVLHPTEGFEASGTVTFTSTEEGVRVQGTLNGLSEGDHGFHIHRFGDCSASDGTSAGGHYNPGDSPHGAPDDSLRHMGDMGNITAGSDGSAEVDFVDSRLELNGSDRIIGRGVILHEGADDLESQPSGAAGSRIACGVVGIANTGM